MPVQARTRKQLRQSIGYNLGALKVGTATGGTNNTLIDVNTFRGGDDEYIGKLALVTDANDSSQTTQYVNDYTASNNTIQFQQNASFTVASGDEYELWSEPHTPTRIHDFINQAIIDVTGQAYDPIESVALHADGSSMRYDIPSNISIINRLYYRSSVSFTELHSCNSAFDETVDSDFTVSVDTQDKKKGTGSNKFVIAVGASAGDIATDSIASKDISKYDYLEGWAKITRSSETAISDGNLKILLDDSASCASPLETLDIPALTDDTWTFFRIKLGNPELDTAIISIGLEMDSDLGACTVWLDDLKVVQNDTAVWQIFPKHLWRVDRESRDLVLTEGGKFESGYALLKITGGDKPALLSAETDTSEIDDSYIIARATALALSAASGGAGTDPDSLRQQAAFWFSMAEQSKRAFPLLITGRVVE